jgi:NTE family protein
MEAGRMKSVRVHMISDDTVMNDLTAASKLSPTPHLLARLKAAGRAAAQAFLDDGAQGIGSGGIDLQDLLDHG